MAAPPVMQMRRPFDPVAHDLDESFRLTKFVDIRGKCKVPQEVVLKLVEGLKDEDQSEQSHFLYGHMPQPQNQINLGMGCSVSPTRHGGLSLVQTTDFFYPLVDDPYMAGKIAAANVLSDLYAMGVMECDNMLMLLGVSSRMSDKEREVVLPLMMRGFRGVRR